MSIVHSFLKNLLSSLRYLLRIVRYQFYSTGTYLKVKNKMKQTDIKISFDLKKVNFPSVICRTQKTWIQLTSTFFVCSRCLKIFIPELTIYMSTIYKSMNYKSD
jgi:hypothetical protein